MKLKMLTYIYEKISNILPVGGGSAGAVYQINNVSEYFPAWEVIISTIIVAIIGAIIGYAVKLILDVVFHNLKQKHNI